MIQPYQGVIPTVTVQEERVVARFFPGDGAITVARATVNDGNGAGDTTFDIRVAGVSIYADPGDRLTIASGDRAGAQAGLNAPTVSGDMVEVVLMSWPAGGFVGPGSVEVGVDDGESGGGEATATDAQLPLEDFVTAYYEGILGRTPSGSELSDETEALATGCYDITFLATAQGLISDLFAGAEFLALATTDEEFVVALYGGYFNREPDATGLAYHVGQVAAVGRADVRSTFASHREFVNRLTLYCRNQLPQANAISIGDVDPETYIQGVAGPQSAALIDAAFAAKGAAGDVDEDLALKDEAVTNAKLANVPTGTFKGRATAGTGVPENLTAAQAAALLPTVVGDSGSGGVKGLVPAPAAGDAAKFLRGDGAYATPPAPTTNVTDVQVFTANGTWNKPVGATFVYVVVIGGGGGGAGGRGNAAGTSRNGGGGGGGGASNTRFYRATDLPSSVNVIVGGGGAAGVGGNPHLGSDGTGGGSSAFHDCFAGGGGAGQGSALGSLGGGGGGVLSSGVNNVPGNPTIGVNAVGGAGAQPGASNGGYSEYGGAGAGNGSATTAGNGGQSESGGAAGGAGGGTNSSNAGFAGGNGGKAGQGGTSAAGGAANGTNNGANGSAGGAGTCGGGGGGGGGNNGSAGNGGAGGVPGGGGGGGGGGVTSGNGGAGGRGEVRIYSL